MAITGIDTIDGKQIIAAGAVSAKSAEMAYNDENGNPITGKLDASASGSLPYARYNSATHAIVEDGITATPKYLALSGFLTAVPSQISANNLLGVNAGTLTTPQLTADRNGVNATGKGFISTNNTGTVSLTYTSGLSIIDNAQGRSASIDGLSGINLNAQGKSVSIDGLSGINFSASNVSASVNYSGLNIKNNNQGREISISAANGGKVYIDDKGASGLDGYGNVNWQVGGPAKQLVNAGGDPQPGIIMAPAPTSVSAQWTAMTRVSGNNTGLWAYAGPTASAPYAQFMGQNISIEFAPTNAHAGIGVGDVTAGIYTAKNDPDKITWSLTGSVQKREIECDTATSAITAIAGSAIAGGGSAPTYGYTDNGLISSIDTSGLYATSALEAKSANTVKDHGTLGYDLSSYLSQNASYFYWMPSNSPWTTADYATGIFSPLQYATGACLAMNNPATFKGYFKGNEWFIANTVSTVGQMLRGEVHKSRGVHISGATTAGYGFDLNINAVSGVNSTGSWKYGYAEDAALRAVSSCDMHESAFSYDASDNITAYNGSAFKAGDEFPQSATEAIETVTANSADWNGTTETVSSNSGAWGGSALPISAGPGIKFEMNNGTLVAFTDGYVWQSASLFHTDTPVKQTIYTLSDDCSNYDKLEVDFYDINNWRTVMDCPIPPNLAASGTRGGYFSVVPESTATGSNIWFKAFNWTVAGTTWTCYCSEIAAQGGSTTQTVNANQPDNPPKVVNIIGWKRVGGN